MNEREFILARVREALRNPAPRPNSHDGHDAGMASGQPISRWLPKVGETFEERLDLFRTNTDALKAEFHLVHNQEEANACLLTLRDAEGWKRIASHRGQLTDAASVALGLPTLLTDSGYDVNEMEKCDAGITECDALVAQTGSVVVTNRSAGGRALSVLPPHHVVLAQREQLLADLPGAFELLAKKYGANYPSFMSFITGPSRTGDIERILVLGAHGPKKLTIICF
jgi:L-lactate dehydrogenase complex protein LldG